MHVKVTEEDIKLGVPCDPARCPIGKAISRALDEQTGFFTRLFGRQVDYVTVGHFTVNFWQEDAKFLREANLPVIAADFIRDFDQNQEVRPIEFEL